MALICSSGDGSFGQSVVVHFNYGGQYLKKGDEIFWSGREDVHYAILMSRVDDVLTYNVLVEMIRTKMGESERSNEMKLSYFPADVEPKRPVYISNTMDFLIYLEPIGGKRNGVLHVETKTNIPREYRSSNASNDVHVASSRIVTAIVGTTGMLPSVPSEEEDENMENVDDDTHFGEHDEFDVRETELPEDNVPVVEWDDGMILRVGQEFACKKDVQEMVEKAAFLNCFNYLISKSDPTRYVVKCGESEKGCKWYLRATRVKGTRLFSIRTYVKMHTCSRVSSSAFAKKRRGTPQLVASVVLDHYPGKLNIPVPKILIGIVKGIYGVTVSYSTALRGRNLALAEVRGTPADSYVLLHCYLYMLREKNPGTVYYVEVDEAMKFKYLFFALGASIQGFEVMRKVIIVDGTHIKNAYGGVLLVATAQDPNHHHYPIAFGVVDGEKDASCGWFFEKLKTIIPDEPGLVFLSDRNQSLIKMIREVYPLSHHGYCIFHLSQNVKMHASNTNKDRVAAKFREMAQAYTEPEFLLLADQFLTRFPSAWEYVERSVERSKWARCYFPGERYNMDTTNCAESLNAVFREARTYSMLPMFDTIIAKLAEWFNTRRQTSTEGQHKLVPYIENILNESCIKAQQLPVLVLNNYLLQFQVTTRDGKSHFVDLRVKTCTCNHFDIDKYPCVHALAALKEARGKGWTELEVHDLCSEYYGVQYWMSAYGRTIYPVPHMSQWMVTADVHSKIVFPPDRVVSRGRRQENRFPSMGEGPRRQRRNKNTMYAEFQQPPSQQS